MATSTKMHAGLVEVLNKALALVLLEKMVLIRTMEERFGRLFADGELKGFIHLSIGQEAVPTGVCARLREDDYITSTHRGHGHLLAKGGDPKKTMAELYAKKEGYCKGRGGSMHVADIRLGILGANGIVGAGPVLSIGAGLSAKALGNNRVCATFYGDGASNQGMVHEAMNMAALWKLPVVFVCENNGYGEFTSRERHQTVKNIALRAQGYGMPGVTVDGDDVEAVYKVAGEAVTRARNGEGPTLLECVTHRAGGHYHGDPQKYRDPKELETISQHCPIKKFKEKMISEKVITVEEYEAIKARVVMVVDEAVEFGRNGTEPDPQDFWKYNYAD